MRLLDRVAWWRWHPVRWPLREITFDRLDEVSRLCDLSVDDMLVDSLRHRLMKDLTSEAALPPLTVLSAVLAAAFASTPDVLGLKVPMARAIGRQALLVFFRAVDVEIVRSIDIMTQTWKRAGVPTGSGGNASARRALGSYSPMEYQQLIHMRLSEMLAYNQGVFLHQAYQKSR